MSGRALLALAALIDGLNERIGRAVAWLTVAMVLVQFAVVACRYVFGLGSTAAQESIVYMHAATLMLGAAYTLVNDGHVRCDVYYARASRRMRAAVDLAGAALALAPFCVVVAVLSWPFVSAAWAVREGSAQGALGLPYVYLLKSLILAFAGLLALQAVALAARALAALLAPVRGADPS